MCTKKYFFMLPVLMILLVTGCFDDRELLFDHQLLEWEPPNRGTNSLSMNVNLEADETESRILTLRMQYAGMQQPHEMTGTFVVDEEQSDAVEGEHFHIPGGTSVAIPAQSSASEEIEIEILSEAIEEGTELDLVLVITGDGDIPPMENYKEFRISISKEASGLTLMEVTLDRPGYLADPDLLDVAAGEVFSKDQANADPDIQARIDFGLWSSSSTELTMIVPTDDDRLGGWGSGRTVRDDWDEESKNDGILLKLPYDADNQGLFDDVLTDEDLLDAFDEAEERITDLDPDDYGPGGHIQYVSTGELIFFRSLDRGIYAIAIVDQSVSGSTGFVNLSVKRFTESD